MGRRVLNDEQLEREFQEQGYVQIPFISPEEVEFLTKKFFELLPESGGNITVADLEIPSHEISYDFTFIDKNIKFKQAVYDVITERFRPYVEKWLADYRPIIANYIRKKTDTGEVPLHQNWAFVDERKCTSVSIWCPLVDSNEENGTLQIVPRSHKRFGVSRGPMVPWELDEIKEEIIANSLVPMNLKAGNAVILDDSVVHYSAINKTDRLRLAIQLILIPSEEKSIHYHMNPAVSMSTIDTLEVDTDFYMQFNPWKQPDGAKRLGTIPFAERPITFEEFNRRIAGKKIDEPQEKGFLERLKAVFN